MSNLPIVKSDAGQRGNEIIQLVTFELAAEEYGVDVLAVREIIRVPAITKMPNAPAFLDGIINLRGTVVPIVSLRRRFNLSEQEQDRRSRILVMEVASGLTGFVVDAVAEVIRISESEIQPPPSLAQHGAAQDCITGVVNHNDRLLIVLDLDKSFSDEERRAFESI